MQATMPRSALMITRDFRIILILLTLGLCQVESTYGQLRTSADEITNAWVAASLVFPENERDTDSSYPLAVSVHQVHPRLDAPQGYPSVLGTLPTTLLGPVVVSIRSGNPQCDIERLAAEVSEARLASQRLQHGALASGFSLSAAVCLNGGYGGISPRSHTVLLWNGGQIVAYVRCVTRSCTLQYLPPLPLDPKNKIVGLKVSLISDQHFHELIEEPNSVIQRVLDTVGFDDAVFERPSIPAVQSISGGALDYPAVPRN